LVPESRTLRDGNGAVGSKVGKLVGLVVIADGTKVGSCVGSNVGEAQVGTVGLSVGNCEGTLLGSCEGLNEGCCEGASVGICEGAWIRGPMHCHEGSSRGQIGEEELETYDM